MLSLRVSAGLRLAVLGGLLTAAPTVFAAQQGPFAGLGGTWSGAGQIMLGGGRTEPIRCRANYAVGAAGNQLQLTLRCASQSFNFGFEGNAQSRAGAVTGTWRETSRNINGQVSGTARNGQIQVTVSGQDFSAGMTVASRGNRQSVAIRANGQADLVGADIAMSRGGRETVGAGQ
ncbi:MAG TPA: hypothetical protein VFB45_19755 [Pseudolabrys sp.]|nr:hypothetical protein [Pseudolabrys sp.]